MTTKMFHLILSEHFCIACAFVASSYFLSCPCKFKTESSKTCHSISPKTRLFEIDRVEPCWFAASHSRLKSILAESTEFTLGALKSEYVLYSLQNGAD